jgi:hypothetical protein
MRTVLFEFVSIVYVYLNLDYYSFSFKFGYQGPIIISISQTLYYSNIIITSHNKVPFFDLHIITKSSYNNPSLNNIFTSNISCNRLSNLSLL